MAAVVVPGLHGNEGPYGMVTTTADVALLQGFANGDDSVNAVEAINTVVRIAQAVSKSVGVSQECMNSARMVLSAIEKNPCAEAVPGLLATCQIGQTVSVANVFMLSSMAWKALLAASLKFGDGVQISPATKIGVVLCALHSLHHMMKSVTSISQGHPLNKNARPSSGAARSLKVARFHSANAARCSKAFRELKEVAQSDVNKLIELLSVALRAVGLLSQLQIFECIRDDIRDDALRNLSPALGLTLRSVLSMVCYLPAQDNEDARCAVLCAALEQLLHGEESLHESAQPSNCVLAILAALHMVRYAMSESPRDVMKEPADAAVTMNEAGVRLCRENLRFTLIPFIFKHFASAYCVILGSRHKRAGLLFLGHTCAIVEEAVLLINALDQNNVYGAPHIDDFLLVHLNKPNSLQALLAEKCLIRLFKYGKTTLNDPGRLLLKVLKCTQISLSFCPGYAERRWIPLASSLAQICLTKSGSLKSIFCAHQVSSQHRNRSSQHESVAIEDPFVLRVVASLIGLCLSQTAASDSEYPSSRYTQGNKNAVDCILDALGIAKATLIAFVESSTRNDLSEGGIGEAALYMLPYLVDAKTASEAALSCLKRKSSSLRVLRRALNILDPAVISCPSVQDACTALEFLIQKHGVTICTPVTAFAARAAALVHRNVSLASWNRVAVVLDMAIHARNGNDDLRILQDSLSRAAVLYHANSVLFALYAPQALGSNRNTHATVPSRARDATDDAKKRFQLWAASTNSFSITCDELPIIEKETCIARVKPLLASEQTYLIEETEFRNNFRALRTGILRVGRQALRRSSVVSENTAQVRSELNQMQDFLHVLTGLLDV